MKLTKQNYRVFAAHYYDNPLCVNEAEFDDDLFKVTSIKKLVTSIVIGIPYNLQLILNQVVCFYNVFEHQAATQLLEFKMSDEHIPYMNSVLTFLSFPLMRDGQLDNSLLIELRDLTR